MMGKRIMAFAVSIALVSTAQASVQSEMQSWFNDLGSMGNVTTPQVIQGQTQTVYTGGSLYMRSPVRNYQLGSFQPPSVRGGCGGIDVFAGSFSFISSENLTALMRNIANNAIGYAFMAAIKSIDPMLGDIMQYLQDQASKINNMNLNSCQMAEGIVTAAADALTDKKEQSNAQGTGSTLSNLWSDSFMSFDTWRKDKNAKKQAREQAANADAGLKEMLQGGNLVWRALGKTNVPDELKELMMSLIGTIIITPPADPDGGNANSATWDSRTGSGIGFKDFIGDPTVQTHRLALLKCDDLADCKNPAIVSNQPTESFAWRVNQVLIKAIAAIRSRTPQAFTELDSAVFTSTAVPVWRLAAISATGGNDKFIQNYSRAIAIELANSWFKNTIKTLEAALAKGGGGGMGADAVKAIEGIRSQIAAARQLAAAEYMAEYQKAASMIEMQRATQWMHETMMRSMPTDLQRSMLTFNR